MMMVVGCILFTIWLVGFLGFSCFEMMSGHLTARRALAWLFWPALMIADYVDNLTDGEP